MACEQPLDQNTGEALGLRRELVLWLAGSHSIETREKHWAAAYCAMFMVIRSGNLSFFGLEALRNGGNDVTMATANG